MNLNPLLLIVMMASDHRNFIILCGILFGFILLFLIFLAILDHVARKVIPKRLEAWCKKNGFQEADLRASWVRRVITGTGLRGYSNFISHEYTSSYKGSTIRYCLLACFYKNPPPGKYMHYFIAITPLRSKIGWLEMRKETKLDKAKAALGDNDLDFENKKFSDLYYVDAKPEGLAYRFFTPRMIETLLNDKRYFLYISNGHLIIYRSAQPSNFQYTTLLLNKLRPQISLMSDTKLMLKNILDHIPSYLNKVDMSVKRKLKRRTLLIECPLCSAEFRVYSDTRELKCPNCGVEGEL